MQPEASLHWLAVNGVQPQVPENPSVGSDALDEAVAPAALSREQQLVYLRTVRALEAGPGGALTAALLDSLATDPGMQALLPHIALFVYSKVRGANRSPDALSRCVRAIGCLVLNPHCHLEHQLQQLLPALLTCGLARRSTLSSSSSSSADLSELRLLSAGVVAFCCHKYVSMLPDIQVRPHYICCARAHRSPLY